MICVNHLLFADDMLIFSNGERKSLKNLLSLFEKFCNSSGHMINLGKSSIFMSDKIPDDRKEAILQLTGFQKGNFPVKYLGAPLFCGRALIEYFEDLEERIRSKISGWLAKLLSMGGKLILIQAVLSSIPIYTLSVLPVPVTVLKRLDKLMANFLWDNAGLTKKHWISWERICKPKAEGGLGLKAITQRLIPLHAKLAWDFIEQKSFWSKFMMSRHGHSGGSKGSALWEKIQPIIQNIKGQICWVIGRGDISLARYLQTNDVNIPDQLQNIKLADILGSESLTTAAVNFISSAHMDLHDNLEDIVLNNTEDRLVWIHSESGLFSSKGYWKHLHPTHQTKPSFHKLWQEWIPPKVSCLMWRLLHRALPTDDRVARFGIQLASKCRCCCSPDRESISHSFLLGDQARSLWRFFGHALNKPLASSIDQFAKIWIEGSNVNTALGQVSIIVACCGMWELWKWRNARIHEEPAQDPKRAVFRWLWSIDEIGGLPATSLNDISSFQALRMRNSRKKIQVWRPWVAEEITLSVGLQKNAGVIKAGFIVRDSHKQFLLAWTSHSTWDPHRPCQMIREGVEKLKQTDIHVASILVNNRTVCEFLNCKNPPWRLVYHLRQCRHALKGTPVEYRCQNHSRTAMVLSEVSGEFTSLSSLPLPAKCSFYSDQWGIPYPCTCNY